MALTHHEWKSVECCIVRWLCVKKKYIKGKTAMNEWDIHDKQNKTVIIYDTQDWIDVELNEIYLHF